MLQFALLKVAYVLDDNEQLWLQAVLEAVVHVEADSAVSEAVGADVVEAEKVLKQLKHLLQSAEAKGVTLQESFEHFDRAGTKYARTLSHLIA